MNEQDARDYLRALGLSPGEIENVMSRADLTKGSTFDIQRNLEQEALVVTGASEPGTIGFAEEDSPEVARRQQVVDAVEQARGTRETKEKRAEEEAKALQEAAEERGASVEQREVVGAAANQIREGNASQDDLLDQLGLAGADEETRYDPFVSQAFQQWGFDPEDPESQERLRDAYETWSGAEWTGPLDTDFYDAMSKLPGQLRNQIVLDAAGRTVEQSAIYPTVGGGRLVLSREEGAVLNRFPELGRHFGRVVQASETSGVPEALLATLFTSLGVFDRTSVATIGEPGSDPGRAGFRLPGAADQVRDAGPTAEDEERSFFQRASLDFLGERFKRLQAEFGDWTIAFVAMHDENLARKMYSNPYGLTGEERQKLGEVMVGWDAQMLTDAGVFINKTKYDFANELASGAAAGAGGTVTLPDPATLDEALRTLYRTWFQNEPTTEALMAFQGTINGEIRSQVQNEKGNPFQDNWAMPMVSEEISVDPASRAIAFMRGRPEYAHLFGHKPAGLSEEQYAAQFQAGVQSVLGPEQMPEAVRAGMESGSYQTTVGQSFFGGVGRPEEETSSTLEGRMARAAKTIRPLL